MNEQLSVTTWPGVPVPMPGLMRYPGATIDGEIIWIPNWGEWWELAPPPPELYLRHARQVDALNPEALLNFVRTVGGVPYIDEDRDLFKAEGRSLFAADRDRRYVTPQLVAGRGFGVHLDEVAYRLRVLDVLGQHAVAYQKGNYLAPIWQQASAKRGNSHRIKTEEDAWLAFAFYANQALRVFHARVRVLREDGEEIGHEASGGGATFLEAGVLQIVNDLADEVDYRTCPNCERYFGRQVDGSTYYSRRTGVTYCSVGCGTAARVKAYRARKRAARAQR